ncbi:hypothetical protein [Pseudogulbenkiania sp. MAI-1]|uniref:hypothetical protein n=1 Tax=Pseudogulbenkiania sp. MAI-1 TaxID=990370 RepID=UPI00045E5F58|nr:hypothetical protein [Pseudogulbenkiania sp. MAI-1]
MSEQLGSYGLDGLSDERPLGADAAEDEWDEGDVAEALEDGFESMEEGFEAVDAMGAVDGLDERAFDDDAFAEAAFSDEFDSDAGDDYAMEAWSAFEEELADGLDAADNDEFLGRILGGLGRAASRLARNPGLQRAVGQVRGAARAAGQAAGGIGSMANAAAWAANALGAPQAAGTLRQVGGYARRAQSVAGGVGRMAGRVQRRAPRALAQAGQTLQQGAANPMGFLMAQLSQLLGQQADELDAFDEFADLYVEDGIDEALPLAVGLAARAAASALGRGAVARMAQPARRALVRGVANTARQLLSRHGPRALRALPRVARGAVRVARQRQVPVAQVPALMQRVGRQVAAQPQLVRRLAQQPAGSGMGSLAAAPTGNARRFRINGPVEISIVSR